MTPRTGAAVAERALEQIGTPFRLHGRTPGVAFDCVGLIAHATDAGKVDVLYGLKGTKIDIILSYMDLMNFECVACIADIRDGDIAVVACSPRQFHLMIRAANGWVHSHAGLRKVVHTPGAAPWPIIALRRKFGE